jgi:alkanesulfonate monooxygenase SsuD/methylene tetrahydromethanopterin reductase-like flavin-dependent oxidoreductase (luciferase family)
LKTIEFYTILGDRHEVDRVVADTARRTGADEAYIRSWHPLSGDAERIAQIIGEYVEAGIQYFIVNVPNAFEGGVISRFAEEVFPKVGFRSAPPPGLRPGTPP